MKKKSAIAVLIVLPLLVLFIYQYLNRQKASNFAYINKIRQKPGGYVLINDLKIFTHIADSQEKRRLGLSVMNTMPKDEGMLFYFGIENTYPIFWMKDMNFPIDIIWIDDNKILHIDKNIPPPTPGAPDNKLTLYRPPGAIDYVLEVNANFTDENTIKVGDEVDLQYAFEE